MLGVFLNYPSLLFLSQDFAKHRVHHLLRLTGQ